MTSSDQIQAARREAEDHPLVWFAVLQRARVTGDDELIDKAQSALLRLGVTVTFDRLPGQAVPV